MAGIVVFDYASWVTQFPAFAAVTQPTALGYFNAATTIHTNNGYGPVTLDANQLTQLNWLTAHFAAMFSNGTSPAPANGPVGRLASASEGSVSASFDMPGGTASSAWFMQTKYGAMYWQMTAAYRTMRYRPGRRLASTGTPGGMWPGYPYPYR